MTSYVVIQNCYLNNICIHFRYPAGLMSQWKLLIYFLSTIAMRHTHWSYFGTDQYSSKKLTNMSTTSSLLRVRYFLEVIVRNRLMILPLLSSLENLLVDGVSVH